MAVRQSPWFPLINGSIVFVFPVDPGEDPGDFLVLQRHQELLGERARDCGVSMTIEKTGMEDTGQYTLSFVLYRWVCMCLGEWVGFVCVCLFTSSEYYTTAAGLSITTSPSASLALSLFIPGGLLLTSSRAAVWRRPNCTPCSCTQCSPVGTSELEEDYNPVYFPFAVH